MGSEMCIRDSHHDSNQLVDMRGETDKIVSKNLCGKIPSMEVDQSVNTYSRLL